MFKNALHVPGKGEGEAMSSSMMEEILHDQDLIQQLRKYFLLLTHFSELLLQNYAVEKTCSEYAQSYFVQ